MLDVETKGCMSVGERLFTDNIKKIKGIVPFEEDNDKGQFVWIWTSSDHLVFGWIAHPFYSREKLLEVLRKALRRESGLIESGRIKEKKPEEQDKVQEKCLHAIRVLDEHVDLKYPTTYLRIAANNQNLTIEKKEEQYQKIFKLESTLKYEDEEGEINAV